MSVTSIRLKARREQLGYTQDELAELINGSQKQIWRYESGNGFPSVETLVALAKVLETSTDWLLGLTDVTKPVESDSSLDKTEIELLRLYRQKTPDKQDTILRMVRAV